MLPFETVSVVAMCLLLFCDAGYATSLRLLLLGGDQLYIWRTLFASPGKYPIDNPIDSHL